MWKPHGFRKDNIVYKIDISHLRGNKAVFGISNCFWVHINWQNFDLLTKTKNNPKKLNNSETEIVNFRQSQYTWQLLQNKYVNFIFAYNHPFNSFLEYIVGCFLLFFYLFFSK